MHRVEELMNFIKGVRHGLLCIGIAWLGATALAGCSSSEGSPPSTEEPAGASDHELTAGTAGKKVGVEKWLLAESGIVQALGADGKLLGKLQMLEENGGIVSLTEGGARRFDASGAVTTDTLSALEQSLLEALREDLIADSEAYEAAANEPGAQKALEWIAFPCCANTQSGTFHQWWSGGWTPYCAVRAIANTTCNQNLRPQCWNLFYQRGCKYSW